MLTLLPDRPGRVEIRPVVPADQDALIAAHRASRDYHAPWTAPFTDAAGFERWFAARVTGGIGLLAHETGSGALVGLVSLTGIVLGTLQGGWLGFHGMAATAGRGLMADAVRLACLHGFTSLGLHRIEANIQPGNARSIALVRRLGFRLEGVSASYLRIDGTWRDHGRWALLDHELNQTAGEAGPAPTAEIERFWSRFRAETGLGGPAVPGLTTFGADAVEQDALALLARRGRKRAPVSLRHEYGLGAPVVPATGDLAIVLDGRGAPVCVIRTAEVRLGPLSSLDDAFVWDEGEGDRTRADWLATHHASWAACGMVVDDGTTLVFERFATIWPDA